MKKRIEFTIQQLLTNSSSVIDLSNTTDEIQSKIELDEMKILAEAFKSNSSCEKLDVSRNNLGDECCILLCESLKSIITLKELNIENNYIKQKGTVAILELLNSNSSITILNLADNNIGNEGVCVLSKFLYNNTSLTKLNLAKNNISEEGIVALGKSLENNSSLKRLSIGCKLYKGEGNTLENEAIASLSELIEKNNSIIKLDLSRTSIGRDSIIVLCKALKINTSISKLKLIGNNIGNEGAIELSKVFLRNSSLKHISLEENQISNQGLVALWGSISQNPTILTLNLKRNNEIDGNHLLTKIFLKKKENLLISEKSVTKKDILVDEEELIQNYSNVKSLSLLNCSLENNSISFNQFRNLVILNLSNNNFTEVPDLETLINLLVLNLSGNKIKLNLTNHKDPFSEFLEICDFKWKLPKSLKILHLYGNKGIDKNLENKIFYALPYICYKGNLETHIKEGFKLILWIALLNDFHFDNLITRAQELIETNRLNFASLGLHTLNSLPLDIEHIRNCSSLTLKGNKLNHIPSSILSLENLSKLDFRNNQFRTLSDQISSLTHLNEIWLEGNQFTHFPLALSKVTQLKQIWLDDNIIHKIEECKMVNLQKLSLSNNQLSEISPIFNWELLQVLFLDDNNISEISPTINKLRQLKRLHLNKNELEYLPEEICDLKFLEDLKIRNNKLKELPLRIGELERLISIDVYQNRLTHLPPSIAFLTKIESFDLKKNPLESPPSELISDWKAIQGYFNDLLTGHQNCNYIKLVIVGEENVGKTTLVRALKAFYTRSFKFTQRRNVAKSFKKKPLSTDGVEIQSLEIKVDPKYNLPNNSLIFNIWDLGGQRVYYSTHAFFISERALYLVVWDMSKQSEEIERVIFWLKTIQSLVPQSFILLVGTHLDEVQSNKLDPYKLYEDMSQKSSLPLANIIGVSCKTGENFVPFTEILINFGLDIPMVGKPFPKMYLDLKEKIDRECSNRIPIMEWNEFKELGKSCHLVNNHELLRATQTLHILGFCLHFPKDKILKNYVVLNPQWFANTLSTLISTKSEFIQKRGGILDHQHLLTVWKEYPQEIHSVLLRLMENFHVSIPITNLGDNIYEGQSVIPALLSEESIPSEILKHWIPQEIKLKRMYQFQCLPIDLFPRLVASILVIMGIRRTRVWKDGLLINQNDSKALISFHPLYQGIITSFSGRNWFSLFQRVKLTLNMLVKRWEDLPVKVFVTCSNCFGYHENPFEWFYCFEWNKCYQAFSDGKQSMHCEKNASSVAIVELVPELVRSDIPMVNVEDIILEEKLGEGSFSVVYKGEFEGKPVAVKQIKTIELETELREFIQEIEILHNENHPNLLQVIAIVASPPWLISPLAGYGSLAEILYNLKFDWNWKLALRVSYDIASGLNYLHNLDPPVLHCDIRSPNILIFSLNETDSVVAKVADFGLAQYSLGRILVKDKSRLNPSWTAPEVLEGKDLSRSSDCFSYGMVLYEILTRSIPFDRKFNSEWNFESNIEEAIIKGIRPPYVVEEINRQFNAEIPPKVFHILQAVWHANPSKRPTFKVIVKTLHAIVSTYWNNFFDLLERDRSSVPFSRVNSFLLSNEFNTVKKFSTLNDFIKERKIGSASSHENYFTCSVTNWKGTFVMKEVKLTENSTEIKNQVLNEIQTLDQLNAQGGHPNVVKLLGYYVDSNVIILITEYFEEGSLDSILWRRFVNQDNFSAKEVVDFSLQILRGLTYLHENKIAHRNLKSASVLVKLNDISSVRSLHLTNFGSATLCHDWKLETNKTTGIKSYMAPELLKEEEIDLFAADMFSFGILLSELVIGHPPVQEKIRPWPSEGKPASKELKESYEKCTQLEPILRPTSSTLLSEIEKLYLSLQ